MTLYAVFPVPSPSIFFSQSTFLTSFETVKNAELYTPQLIIKFKGQCTYVKQGATTIFISQPLFMWARCVRKCPPHMVTCVKTSSDSLLNQPLY